MRSAEFQGQYPGASDFPFKLRIPHSALRILYHWSLNVSDDGLVTHAVTHTPQPTHPSIRITGCPAASIARARSPTGQARAHTPQDTPWNVIQRCGSSSSTPMCTDAQPSAGTSSAPVSQACAHGMSAHTTQAWSVGSIIGVPAASPALAGAVTMACTGQTSMQSPQRGQDARDAVSGGAPGGRNPRRGATRPPG